MKSGTVRGGRSLLLMRLVAATEGGFEKEAAGLLSKVATDYPESLLNAANELIRAGQWKAATVFLRPLVQLDHQTNAKWHEYVYRLAFILVHLNEKREYQALCRRAIGAYRTTKKVQLAERISKMCLFAGMVEDPKIREQAARLADFAIANIDDAIASRKAPGWLRHFVEHTKGIAEYRRGNYASARDWLQKSAPGISKAGQAQWDVTVQATDSLFLAMSAHQLGKANESRKWFAHANRLIGTLPETGDNTDWLLMQIVRREAKHLITGKAAANGE